MDDKDGSEEPLYDEPASNNPYQWQKGDFRPKIRGDDADVAAGVPGPGGAGPPPPGSKVGYIAFRSEYRPQASPETKRFKRLMTPSYPRTGIPIGYNGFIPGKRETFGATYGLEMGTCTPNRERNLGERKETKSASNKWSTSNAIFDADRLASAEQPGRISPERVSSAPPHRPVALHHIERHRRDSRRGSSGRPLTAGALRQKVKSSTSGSGNLLFDIQPPGPRCGWSNNRNRLLSPRRGPPDVRVGLKAKLRGTAAARRTWNESGAPT